MRRNRLPMLFALFGVIPLLGAQCIGINEPGVFAVNVKDITGTYNISTGVTQFGNPPGTTSCATKNAAEYIDQNFATIKGGRLVDITVQTNGSFNANVTNGSITINGTQLLSYSGSWNAFNTPQSLLTNNLMQRNQAGVTQLINAITSQQTVTICGSGGFSSATPAGLSVTVKVFAQLDAQP